mmetsp:Transcript_46825/g.91414  ORF Transcript_46825/g.91414 Transcript_46825/m.91414 type:complete len:289 (-) Transcript_46825:11-877(-)
MCTTVPSSFQDLRTGKHRRTPWIAQKCRPRKMAAVLPCPPPFPPPPVADSRCCPASWRCPKSDPGPGGARREGKTAPGPIRRRAPTTRWCGAGASRTTTLHPVPCASPPPCPTRCSRVPPRILCTSPLTPSRWRCPTTAATSPTPSGWGGATTAPTTPSARSWVRCTRPAIGRAWDRDPCTISRRRATARRATPPGPSATTWSVWRARRRTSPWETTTASTRMNTGTPAGGSRNPTRICRAALLGGRCRWSPTGRRGNRTATSLRYTWRNFSTISTGTRRTTSWMWSF